MFRIVFITLVLSLLAINAVVATITCAASLNAQLGCDDGHSAVCLGGPTVLDTENAVASVLASVTAQYDSLGRFLS